MSLRKAFEQTGSLDFVISEANHEIQQVVGQNILPTAFFYPVGDKVGVTIEYANKSKACPKFTFKSLDIDSFAGRGPKWVFAIPSGIVRIRMDSL